MELFSKNSNVIVRAVVLVSSIFAKSGPYSQVSECPRDEVASLVMDGKVKVKIGQVFDLEDIVPCRKNAPVE